MIKKTLVLVLACIPLFNYSQNSINSLEELKKAITYNDSVFWNGFNSCDIEVVKNYVSDDLEFYHDKNGVTIGSEVFIKTVEQNLCSNSNFKMRRKALQETIHIYPIKNYGAIISGEHVFYISQNGNQESLDGIAKFSNLWHYKDGNWKMTRVLSYDHKPAPQNFDKKEIIVSGTLLHALSGKYYAPNLGDVVISNEKGILKIKSGNMLIKAYPNSESTFFSKEAPLTFEFLKDTKGKISKMIVRENNKIVDEVLKQD
ncbi:nuclear transport factor 2 family protein [Seonamhaeicola marinus]|uniref:DUF4440 domain-containing protein n=1 Tax=Seonamhaeicola marinus TaxID=1912246 RepID=A0A5D0IND6_9FLAO|nr:nuclear transport factor 2 family protein [Seonamhaeicola marinus]TYA84380.1 DUF4440 domain-containing protein [Seonamhaeicola marinus]